MPKYKVQVQAIEHNVHEVTLEADAPLPKDEVEQIALAALFTADEPPAGVHREVRFNVDGETVEADVLGVEVIHEG